MAKRSRQGASNMDVPAPAEITRNDALQLLAVIVKNRQSAVRDRLEAIRIHSRWLGYELTESQIWTVFVALANGGTESQ